ncbi:MAG: hypothetical protein GF418_10575 [Chitinivibrionales bacterium]|nr:hypothetical protein [Chitinivibrionales bacterium]MBD3396058.1 hypothetical protein [Chitinivibrionales bacterium]
MKTVAGLLSGACLVLLNVSLLGCGPKIEELESRLQTLEESGVPDSLLSQPKVFLYQLNAAKKSSNSGLVRKNKDSLVFYLEKAEAWYAAGQEKLKPEVDKLVASINERKGNLSGMQLKVADSMVALIDSFAGKNWMLQAHQKASLLDSMMPALLRDEETVEKLKPRVTGTWISDRIPSNKGLKARERKKFTFAPDGKLHVEESMKGQTEEYLKEDWAFESWGTWDIKGDTVYLYVDREKCARQVYTHLKEVDGRKEWVREEKPTYDTTITDGSKDRFMTWDYFEQWLKKI